MKTNFFKFLAIFIAFVIFISSLMGFKFSSYAVDASSALVLDDLSQDIFGSEMNGAYHVYWSPEMLTYGMDAAYQQINQDLYEKYGWDIETVTWQDLGFAEDLSAYNQAYNPLLDTITGQGDIVDLAQYHLFTTVIPWAKQGTQDAYTYILGKIDSLTGKITDIVDNIVIPFNPSSTDVFTDEISELIENDIVIDYSSLGLYYSKSYSFTDSSLSVSTPDIFSIVFSDNTFVYTVLSNNQYYVGICAPQSSFTRVGTTRNYTYNTLVSGIHVNGVTQDSYTSARVTNPSTFYVDDVPWFTGYLSLAKSGGLIDVTTSTKYVDVNYVIDTLGGVLELPHSYKWGNARVKELLDRLTGQYVDTNTIGNIIDTLDDSYPVPIPQEQEGIISDSLPLLLPDDEVLDGVDDIIDDVIAWNEEIAEVVEDIPIEDVLDPDIPVPPTPDNPFPDVPPSLPEWVVPPFLPDIFNSGGAFDIFKPIFDIVGTTYSMDSTWVLIPSILIFILILYFIVSVL